MKIQIKGKEILIDGKVVGSIIGSRDKSGKGNHEGYWISLKNGHRIGHISSSERYYKRGVFPYFDDARQYAIGNPQELMA